MKWQNLLNGTCPRCGSKLVKEKDRVILYVCADPEEECQFIVSETRYLQMLQDPESPVYRFASPEEVAKAKEKTATL